MKLSLPLGMVFLFIGPLLWAQTIQGIVQDSQGEGIPFANVVLKWQKDSSIAKVEVSQETGAFKFNNLAEGKYYLEISFVGYETSLVSDLPPVKNGVVDAGVITLQDQAIELEGATVVAQRPMVEIKPDRTVFNVQGTINSAGENGLELLRKAPGVLVDNNDNITVLSRSGVLVYVDGKRLPLRGEDLSNYLKSLTAEQIDRIDIITNPGAKYEAQGNAGIIDIRLKKDDSIGANGSLTSNVSQGQLFQSNLNATGNYRNKTLNAFGSAGLYDNESFFLMNFDSYQNNLSLVENFRNNMSRSGYNARFGTDFFVHPNHTVGFLVSHRDNTGFNNSVDRMSIAQAATPNQIDSILIAQNNDDNSRRQDTYNINYRYNKGDNSLNLDLDYGSFRNRSERDQPNQYFNKAETEVLTEIINFFNTPQDIDIYTLGLDYETKIGKIKTSLGTRLSQVSTNNTFLVYDVFDQNKELDPFRSNQFDYDERVYAGYINFSGQLNDKLSFSGGLRAEQTNATGDLQAFIVELQEPPVEFDYLQWFPSAGLTYQLAQKHSLALNYSRRINRPDYNVLNPFNNQLSELSFEKGNPFLQPEIVNNLELGYTLAYRYNFKIGYSYTTDQITRLIAPSQDDSRANFITWENLAEQTIYSANISAPIQMTKWWNAYFNVNGSYINNQADYGEGAIVDVQVWNYNIFQQHTLDLFKGWKGEVSSWFAGPGVWGGVFRYDVQWSLNVGVQKKFFNERLNMRLSMQDIFYESGWSGTSEFNGLVSTGNGNWDSRRISLSLGYNFGNQKVKANRRKAGLEAESKRVGG